MPSMRCQFFGPMVSPGCKSSSAAAAIGGKDKSITMYKKIDAAAQLRPMELSLTLTFISNLPIVKLKLIAHLQKDRIFFGEKSQTTELIMTAVDGAGEGELDPLVPRWLVGYCRIDRIVSRR